MRVNNFNSSKRILLTLVFGLALSSCEEAKKVLDASDLDGDGLTDAEELIIGTSPEVIDSDGDGFSDFNEVKEKGFNANTNNFLFNP